MKGESKKDDVKIKCGQFGSQDVLVTWCGPQGHCVCTFFHLFCRFSPRLLPSGMSNSHYTVDQSLLTTAVLWEAADIHLGITHGRFALCHPNSTPHRTGTPTNR